MDLTTVYDVNVSGITHNDDHINLIKFEPGSTTEASNKSNITAALSSEELLRLTLGAKSQDVLSAVFLFTIYGLIFITGTLGNICTCIVIVKNTYMQTATNYYLFSLAISDVIILLLALPPEAYSILEAYPWRFGEVFCYVKALLQEMTSYASILTITAFTVERYVAICHPLFAHTFANLSRCIKIIIGIWILSLTCALPYPLHTKLFYFIDEKKNNGTLITDSLICNIPEEHYTKMTYVIQFSTFLFFVFPMTVIVVLYFLIAMALRRAALKRVASQESSSKLGHGVQVQSKAGKAVFRMLVAVVVAFCICWAPFHAQRLLTIYNRVWTPLLLDIQSALFYISGVLYFVGSTINPILYNVMSKRYREAFRETICHCRRKRSTYISGNSFHQHSYYFKKGGRSQTSRLQRQTTILDEQFSKSDESENQPRFSLNGNGEPGNSMNFQHIDDSLGDFGQRAFRREGQFISETKNKTPYCKSCVSDQRETTQYPILDRQVLLMHTNSAESAI